MKVQASEELYLVMSVVNIGRRPVVWQGCCHISPTGNHQKTLEAESIGLPRRVVIRHFPLVTQSELHACMAKTLRMLFCLFSSREGIQQSKRGPFYCYACRSHDCNLPRLVVHFRLPRLKAIRHSLLNVAAFAGNPLAPSIRRVICSKLSFGKSQAAS